MTQYQFELSLDPAVYEAARQRAQAEGKTLDQVLSALLTAYGRGDTESGMSTYRVQSGDSLARIARRIYGDPHKYPIIQKANNLQNPGRIWVGQVLVIPYLAGVFPPPVTGQTPPDTTPSSPAPTPKPKSTPTPEPTPQPAPTPEPAPVDPCRPIKGESYDVIPIVGPVTDRPAAEHGDINLALRGYRPVKAELGLIEMAGPGDTRLPPQLATLFAEERTPEFSSVYQVHHWDWKTNSRGGPITDYEVTLAGFAVKPGETFHVPKSGFHIGRGFAVMVLYADEERITLKYTGEDNVIKGYTLHVEDLCVEPSLLELYRRMNQAGRRQLPALRQRQAFGRARSKEIKVAIRDTGTFMDPRVRKDWWQGQ